MLAVCAGLQVLGRSFPGPDGARVDGLGLLGVDTVGGHARACGGRGRRRAPGRALGTLTGFENHAGRTVARRGRRAARRAWSPAWATATAPTARSTGGSSATYLHGPVLARNPALADHLLALALGDARARAARARTRRGAARRAPRRAPRVAELSRSSGRRRRAGRRRRRGRGAPPRPRRACRAAAWSRPRAGGSPGRT